MTTSREVPISLKIPLNNMENIIEVRNLKYKYDSESENYTLNDVSFQVKKGNGCLLSVIMAVENQPQFV